MPRAPYLLLGLLLAAPLAAALAVADPSGDEVFFALGHPVPGDPCDAPSADIVSASMAPTSDGRLAAEVRLLDARANVSCAGVPLDVRVAVRGIQTGVNDGKVAAVAFGSIERRYPEHGGAVWWGHCAVIGFSDGKYGDVPGFTCETNARGPAPDAWSIPLAGEVVLRTGGTRAYDLTGITVKEVYAQARAATSHLVAYDEAGR